MAEPNIPLLRKAVEWVEEQDRLPAIARQWNQEDWVDANHDRSIKQALKSLTWRTFLDKYGFRKAEVERMLGEYDCGTAYCVAGRVASWIDERYATTPIVDGVHCAEVAADALGLEFDPRGKDGCGCGSAQCPGDAANHPLFRARNSAADIRRIAEEIAGEAL